MSTDLRWVDNHCHLGNDAAEAVGVAAQAGVVKLIDVGCDLSSSQAAIGRAQVHPGVSATVGLHPHEARHGIDGLEALLVTAAGEPGVVVAVGECGLDFHYDHSPRDTQAEMFAAQIDLANRYALPMVIHTREAWPETFEILDREGMPANTIFHCFTGGLDEAQACVERGGWLSFSGIVTFPSARDDVAAAAAWCPADRVLVETDSPYLAPVPYRGKTNRPAWVGEVGAKVAELQGSTVAEMAEITWSNAHLAYPGL